MEEIISNKEPVSENDLKKIKSDIESVFRSSQSMETFVDGQTSETAFDFDDFLKTTQIEMPEEWPMMDMALVDPSIELPEGTDPTMWIVRIPNNEESNDVGQAEEAKPESEKAGEEEEEEEEAMEVTEEEFETERKVMERERFHSSCSSNARWPRVTISAENELQWSRALAEAGSFPYYCIRSMNYSPMSPEFSEKGSSPEHGMFGSEMVAKAGTRGDFATPPDTPPQSGHEEEEESEDELEQRLRRQMLAQIEYSSDEEDATHAAESRPRNPSIRVALESFDIPFSFEEKRRHHARENCIKRGLLLSVGEKKKQTWCSSREVFEGIEKADLPIECVRSIQKRAELNKFLVILNREDDRNRFIRAIKKEKRKGSWNCETIDNSTYQELGLIKLWRHHY